MKEHTRQQVAKMGSKLHYRTYKVGKHWLVAGISSLALAGVLLGAGSTQAEATTGGNTDAVNDQTSQPTTAGDTLNQQEVPLASATANDTNAVESKNEMKTDTNSVTESVETSTSEPTTDGETPAEATGEQAASTDDSDAVDNVQTYNLGTASDDVADATKAQAEQNYATTGQAQMITRMAADEISDKGLVTINMETPDGHLIISEKAKTPVDDFFKIRVPNTLVITDEQITDLKTRLAEAQAKGSEDDMLPEIGDDAAGRYEFVSATNETDGIKFDGQELQTYVYGTDSESQVFTVIYKKVPILITDHVYTDGSDATGNTGKPTQIILSVDDSVDLTTTNKETLMVTFGDDGQAAITTSKTADTDTDAVQHILSALFGENGIHTISNASIQENLRSIGIRMDGTVDEANTDLSPTITKVTFVYDKNATATTTPVTDLNQEMLDKLKDLYDQAMTDFGNDALETDKKTTGEEGPITPLNGKIAPDPQMKVGVALYV